MRGLALSLGARLDLVNSAEKIKENLDDNQIWVVDHSILDEIPSFDVFSEYPVFFIGVESEPVSQHPAGWTNASFEVLSQTRMVDFFIGYLSGVYSSYEDIMGWGYHVVELSSLSSFNLLSFAEDYKFDLRSVYKFLKKKSLIDSFVYFSDGVSSAVRFHCTKDTEINFFDIYKSLSNKTIVMKFERDQGFDLVLICIESFEDSFYVDLKVRDLFSLSRKSKENPHMLLKFHGVRGSRPTHKKSLLEYGGNSTSIEFCLDSEDFYLFLDCGSGLAHRGMQIGENPVKKNFYWLMTHTHWDHILGLPFFEPFYNSDHQVTFFASKTSRSTFDELLTGVKRSENLPVPIETFQAEMKVKAILPGEKFEIGGCVDISTYQINHQGITLAYRVHYQEDSVAVVTDNAPIDGNYLGENMPKKMDEESKIFEKKFNQGLIEFLKGCHTVVFDTHFTEKNLKPDWGHSTPERALDFCIAAGVKRLVIFHHAPEDQDSDVFDKVKSVYALAQQHGIEVVAAQEGKQWILR
ncbi:MAG: MBL fold metallo-hydrolase [Oligoflexales bacterium]